MPTQVSPIQIQCLGVTYNLSTSPEDWTVLALLSRLTISVNVQCCVTQFILQPWSQSLDYNVVMTFSFNNNNNKCCGTYRKQPFSCLEADQKTVCPTYHWQHTASEDYTPLISVHTEISNNLTVYRNETENTAASFINVTLCRLCMRVSVTLKIRCPKLKCQILGWNLIIQKIMWKVSSGWHENYINYSNTTKNNILIINVSASRRKPSSGLTSGAGRQYVKACPIRGSRTRQSWQTHKGGDMDQEDRQHE